MKGHANANDKVDSVSGGGVYDDDEKPFTGGKFSFTQKNFNMVHMSLVLL